MKKSIGSIAIAFLFTAAVLVLGYIAFGVWVALIFTSGFLGGFLLWLFTNSTADFRDIKAPYWITLILFILHRVEEKISGFFAVLSEITSVPTPEVTSVPIIMLVLTSVGAWLSIPVLVKRHNIYGYYLAWTFFAAMGITELAHFIFPFFTNESYGYFPGMGSVFLLAPAAWWGMYKLLKKS